jgi:hypothetical protein
MKCETCRWWHQLNKEMQEAGIGLCKRFPPSWLNENTCAYPVTPRTDSCGEYEKATPQDPAAASA